MNGFIKSLILLYNISRDMPSSKIKSLFLNNKKY